MKNIFRKSMLVSLLLSGTMILGGCVARVENPVYVPSGSSLGNIYYPGPAPRPVPPPGPRPVAPPPPPPAPKPMPKPKPVPKPKPAPKPKPVKPKKTQTPRPSTSKPGRPANNRGEVSPR